jgi:hypothetical protein
VRKKVVSGQLIGQNLVLASGSRGFSGGSSKKVWAAGYQRCPPASALIPRKQLLRGGMLMSRRANDRDDLSLGDKTNHREISVSYHNGWR